MNNDNINIKNNINNNDDDEDNTDDIFRGCVGMSPFFNFDVFCHISFVAGGRSEFRKKNEQKDSDFDWVKGVTNSNKINNITRSYIEISVDNWTLNTLYTFFYKNTVFNLRTQALFFGTEFRTFLTAPKKHLIKKGSNYEIHFAVFCLFHSQLVISTATNKYVILK